MNQKTRFQVIERDGFTCQYCGRKAPEVIIEVDHMIPVNCGGDDSFDNLITACRECNKGKADYIIGYSKLKYLREYGTTTQEIKLLSKRAEKFTIALEVYAKELKQKKLHVLTIFYNYLNNHDGILNPYDLKFKSTEETMVVFKERYFTFMKSDILNSISMLEHLENPIDIINFTHVVLD